MASWKNMAVLLSVSSLRKSFGARVLFDNLSLSVSDGDRIGLIGPNGSGKTTLLEILAGNEAADTGARALRKQARLAYVPQDSLFGPEDTVGSVLHAAVQGLPLDETEMATRRQHDAQPRGIRERRNTGGGSFRRLEEAPRHRFSTDRRTRRAAAR